MSGSGRYSAARGNLSLLQDVMKRDPAAYRPEFQEQYVHYRQSLGLFRLRPEDLDTAHLIDLLNFIANVSHHFKEDCGDFGPELMELLRSQGPQLEADLRLALVKAVILLRNRRLIPAKDFYVLVFDHLLKCRDRSLRKFAVSSVLAHVKSINAVVGKREGKLSGELEAFVISKLSDAAPIVVRSALLVLIQAYRKGFWKDARLANVIAEAALHANVKIRVTAIKFLLGMRKDGREEDGSEDEESDSEDDGGPEPSKSVKEIMVGLKAGKKTKKRKKAAEKAKQALLKDNKKTGRKRQPVTAAGVCSIALIQDLYDPHEFAERLFKSLSKGKGNDRFEVKLLVMGLCAKVVGIHKLQLLQFYSYLQKYAQPHQREVTKILLYAAQAAHELVPPETIGDLVRAIADAFVTDRNAPEVMTVGLNAIRSVLANAPLAVDEDLLRDLTEYKRYRNKNVSVAARSLIGLFREINPRLLHRKDRGRPTEEVAEAPPPPSFGQGNTNTAVPGAEALLPSAKYADDALLLREVSSEGGEAMFRQDAARYVSLLHSLGLQINEAKSRTLVFSLSSPPARLSSPLLINGRAVEEVSKWRWLGFVLDRRLSWGPHWDATTSAARGAIARLGELSKWRPGYFGYALRTYVSPMIAFSLSAAAPTTSTSWNQLESVFRYSARRLLNKGWRDHSDAIVREAGLQLARELCAAADLRFGYACTFQERRFGEWLCRGVEPALLPEAPRPRREGLRPSQRPQAPPPPPIAQAARPLLLLPPAGHHTSLDRLSPLRLCHVWNAMLVGRSSEEVVDMVQSRNAFAESIQTDLLRLLENSRLQKFYQ